MKGLVRISSRRMFAGVASSAFAFSPLCAFCVCAHFLQIGHIRKYMRSTGVRESTQFRAHATPEKSKSTSTDRGSRAELEPNHTHFIFADAGPEAQGQFGKEINMRVQIENYLVESAESARAQMK